MDIFLWTKCTLGFFLLYFGASYSSNLLVILSIEKFLALYFPFKTKSICTVTIARRVSLVTAVIHVGYNIQFPLMGVVRTNALGQEYCHYGNLPMSYIRVLALVIAPTVYVYAPFVLMILANLGIIYKFMKAKHLNKGGSTESTNQALSKSATRGTAMLLTVSFTFIILTGPIIVVNAIWPENNYPDMAFKIAVTFEYMNHGINGILYCCSGSRFRNELKLLLGCGKGNPSLPSVSGNYASNVTLQSEINTRENKVKSEVEIN